MHTNDRVLIAASTFRAMAKRGAKPSDFDGMTVLKHGSVVKGPSEKRAITFIVSNSNLDRDGDSVQVAGWNLDHYLKNPVVLWAHDHGQLPVAKALSARVTVTNLLADDEFADAELYPFADTVYRMLQGGFLNACSAGFQPTEWDMTDTGVRFLKQDLLEHSVCPVPAHPEALVVARSKGIDTLPMRVWAEKTLEMFQAKGDAAALVRKQLERLRVQSDPSGRTLFGVLANIKMVPDQQVLDLDDETKADAVAEPEDMVECEACKGSGTYEGAPCEKCGGTGLVPESAVEAQADATEKDEEFPSAVGAGTGEMDDFQAIANALATVGTALSIASATLDTLMAGPAPDAGTDLPDETGEDGSALDVILEQTTQAVQALTAVSEMVAGMREAMPVDEPSDDAPAETDPAEAAVADAVVRAEVVPLAVPVETKRWNRRWSKAFDIDRVQIEVSTIEQGLASKYLGVEVKYVEQRSVGVSSFRMGQWLTAIDDLLREEQWQVEDVRALDRHGKETPPTYEMVQLNSTLSHDFLVDGIRFMKRVENGQEVRAVLGVAASWYGLDLVTYGVKATGLASSLMQAMGTRSKALNFLKGEAFALCGEFLPKTAEGFADLFLAPANQAAVERVVKLVNERGASLENRGMILMGPPGTGKTLAARIMRNVADSTFIWVSARDFWYSGVFGGITEAFDLARECAPSILVFEDIDNWLSDGSMDLLKTEMDGVGRSTGVVTILTTNYPEQLPAALLDRPGRFHDALKFGLPDGAVRKAMIAKWLPALDAVSTVKAVDATKGYSGAHVRELCRFAEIIEEQEALPLSSAIERAIAKLVEQRELINQIQTHGSRYRMPDGLVRRSRSSVVEKTGAIVSSQTVDPSAGILVPAPIAPIVETSQLVQRTPVEVELHRACLDLLKIELTPVQRGKVRQAQGALIAARLDIVKQGRVLSAKNEDRIVRAKTLLDEVLAQLQTEPMVDEAGDEKAAAFLTLDDEREIDLDITPDAVRMACERAIAHQLMMVTGRVY